MQHPEIFAFPPLMLIDYYLTIVGAKLSEQGYRNHFKFSDYEANPVFRSEVAKKKWFSPRHWALVGIVTVFCVYWASVWSDPDPTLEATFGCVMMILATVMGFHLANICTFASIRSHPAQIAGQVEMSQSFMLNAVRYRTAAVLAPVTAAAIFSRSPFLLGGVGGLVAFLIVQTIWLWREKRRSALANIAPN